MDPSVYRSFLARALQATSDTVTGDLRQARCAGALEGIAGGPKQRKFAYSNDTLRRIWLTTYLYVYS